MNCRRIRFDAVRFARSAMPLLALFAALPVAQGQQFQYLDKIVVDEPTDFDWVYAHLGTSPATIPADVAEDVKRGGQFSYEFYGPVGDARSGAPLVIFVSPQDRPVGWDFWADVCEAHGVMFAGVRDAGNGVPEARRIRAVLEVLTDVRRHGGRPERTYLVGFSGGAHVAWRVACALPEQFGGVVCIGYAPQPPRSAWQRMRLADRLSLAIISGDREPATAWIEALYEPMFHEYGVRTAVKVMARQGHAMPPAAAMEDAFEWLELARDVRTGDVKRRMLLNRIGMNSREDWSTSFLKEAQGRLKFPDSTSAGIATLDEIVRRWPDLPEAGEARKLLDEYEQRPDKPWVESEQRQLTQLLRIEAAGYERLAHQNEPSLRGQRAALTAHAKLGYRLEVDPTADPVIAGSGDKKFKLEMPAATYTDVDRRFFRRHGLKLVRKGTEVKVLPHEGSPKAAP